MDPIQPIQLQNNIQVSPNGTRVRFIRTLDNRMVRVSVPQINQIPESRIWMYTNHSLPTTVPVVTIIGTPIVNIPGCVKVHKENRYPGGSKNKQNLDNDPKGSMTLCDAGAPYYEPPDYRANELTWQTVYGEPEEEASGVDASEPTAPDNLDTPEPPKTPDQKGDPDCPAPNQPRIGDLAASGDEKVSGYELQPDPNNLNNKICVILYEDIGVVEKFLPSPAVVTTTAGIAAVATTSALLAKPLADLLLKVVKPVIKKVIGKIQMLLGKTPHRPSLAEIRADRYREKRGLLPLKKGPKKKLKKT